MRRLIIIIIGVTLAMFMYFNAPPNTCATSICVGVCVSSVSCYGDCVCIKIGGEVMGSCASIN